MSKLFVDQVDPKTATTLTLGTSGDTINIPSGATLSIASGATLANSGTATGIGNSNDNYFQAYRPGTNASPSAATWTAYVYNATLVNNNSVYDTSSGEFTVPSGGAGRYFFNSQFWASQIDDGEVAQISIWDDTSGSFAATESKTRSSFGYGVGTDKGFACNVSCILDLAVGDKVKTFVYVASGGIFANSQYNYFLGFKLA